MSYTPHTDGDRARMLEAIGAGSLEDLFSHLPAELRGVRMPDVPGPLAEEEITRHLAALAARNADATGRVCFLGMGAYDHHIPAVVDAMAGRGEFFTAYTPYQPEISQGNLQAIFEYQTMMAALTGMEVANASLYDGATALYEAALMAVRATDRTRLVVAGDVNPLYRAALATYARNLELEIVSVQASGTRVASDALAAAADERTAAVIVQYPSVFGVVQDLSAAAEAAHDAGALLIALAYPLALGLIESPGRMGADIVCGEAQSLGIPLQFGGPYLGYLTCRKRHIRLLPGRLVGETVDGEGKRGFVLTLQTREQHIRRAKATSNICTNQALLALRAAIYLTCLGPEGLRETAALSHRMAEYAKSALAAVPGCALAASAPTFNEFALRLGGRDARAVLEALAARGIAGGVALGEWYPELPDAILVAVTERRTKEEVDAYARALGEILAG